MPDPRLARRPSDLTADWASAVLREIAPGASARAVETVDVDIGTTNRIRLRVEHDGAEDLPRRWFVKLPSGSWKARAITALPRLPQTEVRFYAELADRVDVEHPRLLAAVRQNGRGYTLVLEDVTEHGATPGCTGEALSVEQAESMIDLLAQLHAPLWNHPDLDGALRWLGGPVRRLEDALGSALATPLMKRGLKRAGDLIPESLHAPALAYARRRRQAMQQLADAPRTLVHHDCHPGNLYWKGATPGLLDWQLVRVGEGIGDVAYLLSTGLEPEARRSHEDALLERYAEALAKRGSPRPDSSEVHSRYRAHLSYAFEAMVVTLAIGGLMQDTVAREMVRRTTAAVADHESLKAVFRGE